MLRHGALLNSDKQNGGEENPMHSSVVDLIRVYGYGKWLSEWRGMLIPGCQIEAQSLQILFLILSQACQVSKSRVSHLTSNLALTVIYAVCRARLCGILYTNCASVNDLVMLLCSTLLTHRIHPGVSYGVTFNLIPNRMGFCHRQISIETATYSLINKLVF